VLVVVANLVLAINLLANVAGFLYMTPKPKNIAARSLAKFSLILVAILAGLGIYGYSLSSPVSTSSSLREFEIEKGTSVAQIGANLQKSGLIKSSLMFQLVVKQAGLRSKIQAGIYQLSPNLSTLEVARSLTHGLTKEQKLTIPEGYRVEQIADLASSQLGISRPDFLISANGLEGQLFPDTYFLPEGITASELVNILHTNFTTKVGAFDPETIILASLVERETRGTDEKPIVAGILKKRLVAGWPLELDATIQYQLGNSKNWWPDTTLLDRKIPSRYNTYLNKGLPPTPICNPGLTSINAVKNSQASPYWFYLHDRVGNIHFAKTSAEQNQNIQTFIE
jgi:UPF0755 protein